VFNRVQFRDQVLELLAGALDEGGGSNRHVDNDQPMHAPGIWDVDSFTLLQLLVTLEDEFRVAILARIDQFEGDSVDDFVDFIAGGVAAADAEPTASDLLRGSATEGDAERLRAQSQDLG
jgi:acyl carrier protein